MSDRFQTDAYDAQPPEHSGHSGQYPPPPPSRQHAPLPAWLARRLLRADEKVVWVCCPRFNPSWERYVTHPALFFLALALGAAIFGAGALLAEMWPGVLLAAVLIAGGLVFASLVVLGLSCGYFTRLVATNFRVVIMQGYEVCRSWDMDRLPRSLTRYRPSADGGESPTVDLDALKTMLGGASDQFADAKTILAFGKQLGQIKNRENGRP